LVGASVPRARWREKLSKPKKHGVIGSLSFSHHHAR
jgi:hypothetical protein